MSVNLSVWQGKMKIDLICPSLFLSCLAHGSIISCCLMVSNTQIRRDLVADYKVQTIPQCPISAIV